MSFIRIKQSLNFEVVLSVLGSYPSAQKREQADILQMECRKRFIDVSKQS